MARYTVVDKTKKGNRNYYTVKDKKTNALGVFPTEVVREEILRGNIDNMTIKNGCLVFIGITNPFIIIKNGEEEFNPKYFDFFLKVVDFKNAEVEETDSIINLYDSVDAAYLEGSFVAPSWDPYWGGDPGDSPELIIDNTDGDYYCKIKVDNKKIIEKAYRINGYRFTPENYESTLEAFIIYSWDNFYNETFGLVQDIGEGYIDDSCIRVTEGDVELRLGKRLEDTYIIMTFNASVDEDKLYERLCDDY